MTLTVLAVDDSRTMRDLLHAALAPHGFDVRLATDGEHGLEMLNSVVPERDHHRHQHAQARRLRLHQVRARAGAPPGTPILVLTTESAPELKERARSAGATGWIVKPFDQAKLVAAIRRVAG